MSGYELLVVSGPGLPVSGSLLIFAMMGGMVFAIVFVFWRRPK